MNAIISKQKLSGSILIPGSKSHTIRALLLACMAEGNTIIKNPVLSQDSLSAKNAIELFGSTIKTEGDKWTVTGMNGKLNVPTNIIDTRNSGTTTCFVMSMASLTNGITIISGDEQIRRRPVIELVKGLNTLGCRAELCDESRIAPPVVIKGKAIGGEINFSGFTSQYISSIMLSAPLMKTNTHITVENPLEKPYLQMTLDWMKRFGADVKASENLDDFVIDTNAKYKGIECTIPADWSSVAFPLVAAIVTESDVTIEGVDFDDVQGDKEVLYHLMKMGADITLDKVNGTIHIKGGKTITSNCEINLNDIPDSLPALSVAACYAKGTTKFTGLAHVRVKESDRVAVMEELLSKFGAKIETGADYMVVHGGTELTGATINSHGDHRIAMAMIVCGLMSKGTTTIENAECASVSFPAFYELMNNLNANITLK